MAFLHDVWWYLVLIGVMILVHELGHYWAARYFDVKIEAFSFGFGPRLFGFKSGETDFRFCAILFGGMGTRYKRVPRRVLALADFRLSDGQWESLMVPISMAFFFRSTPDARVIAFYPSPAGATESLLPLETWSDIAAANPLLQEMEADVEALLVNRIGHVRGFAAAEYYVLPIDECYKLVGLIRAHWRGLSGGTEVWQEIGRFFEALKQRATILREEANA